MEPHTTKVPALKKLMKRERPLIPHGTDPPPAKKEVRFFPDLVKEIPARTIIREKSNNTM
jgi:hypothetical protein